MHHEINSHDDICKEFGILNRPLTIIHGDCRDTLKTIADNSVHCCVTSPPYFGLRDYGHAGQIGLEQTHDAYVAELVAVFREVRRALREDGTLWLNLGDSYAGTGKSGGGAQGERWNACGMDTTGPRGGKWMPAPDGLKQKDLIGIPWRVAFALQADGWWLRQDIIWHKPNPMPESVKDRCTKAHEYLFLLSKSERYYFDSDAMQEPAVSTKSAGNGFAGRQGGSAHLPMTGGEGTKEPWSPKGRGGKNAFRGQGHMREGAGPANRDGREMRDVGSGSTRNRRSVWTVNTKPYKGAHFATYPTELIEPCILAGCPLGGTVLDPFGGSGTTGEVALNFGRRAILCELNPDYVNLIEQRTSITLGLGLCALGKATA